MRTRAGDPRSGPDTDIYLFSWAASQLTYFYLFSLISAYFYLFLLILLISLIFTEISSASSRFPLLQRKFSSSSFKQICVARALGPPHLLFPRRWGGRNLRGTGPFAISTTVGGSEFAWHVPWGLRRGSVPARTTLGFAHGAELISVSRRV